MRHGSRVVARTTIGKRLHVVIEGQRDVRRHNHVGVVDVGPKRHEFARVKLLVGLVDRCSIEVRVGTRITMTGEVLERGNSARIGVSLNP